MAGEQTVVVIAFDGSPTSRRAVHYASRFLSVDRAIVLTAWAPLDRGSEPTSYDLDGPPDPTHAGEVDIAYAEAQRINTEGLELALAAGPARRAAVRAAGLHGVGHHHLRRRRRGRRSDRHRDPGHHRICGRWCSPAWPITCGGGGTVRC